MVKGDTKYWEQKAKNSHIWQVVVNRAMSNDVSSMTEEEEDLLCLFFLS